jgi:phage/plasmid-like protein (TIGR03299 family)
MAHQIDFSNSRANMAYLELDGKPWHGLGQPLTPNTSITQWKIEAGMNWEAVASPITFNNGSEVASFEGKQVLYRNDNKQQLSVVGSDYKVVQPGEVLEFFSDLVGQGGMTLSSAGCLFDGRRFWATAKTGHRATVFNDDGVEGYLLLSTSVDGTLATSVAFTTVRTVCQNTLRLALEDNKGRVKVSHRTTFNPSMIKESLGLIDQSFVKFQEVMTRMANTKVDSYAVDKFILGLVSKENLSTENQPYTTAQNHSKILDLYKSGKGAEMAHRTVWGALNAATEFFDWDMGRTRSNDAKLWDKTFGKSAEMKELAFERALELI